MPPYKNVKRAFPSAKKTAAVVAKALSKTYVTKARNYGLTPTYRGFNPMNMVTRGPKGETKSVDHPLLVLGCDATGAVQPINLIRTGSTFTNRIGRKISLKSLYLNGYFEEQSSANTSAGWCRVVVVYDKQTNGVAPTWANVFANYDQATAQTTDANAGVNLDYRDRFIILMDERIYLPIGTTPAAGTLNPVPSPSCNEFKIKRFIPLKLMETQYKADSSPAVIGDIATGGLHIMTYGINAAGFSYNANINARLRFEDN